MDTARIRIREMRIVQFLTRLIHSLSTYVFPRRIPASSRSRSVDERKATAGRGSRLGIRVRGD